MLFLPLAIAALGHSPQEERQLQQSCQSQPLKSPIDEFGEAPSSLGSIEFSATPSLVSPVQSWVVRLSHGSTPKLDVALMKVQAKCNHYVIVKTWRSTLREDEYTDLATKAVSVGLPSAAVFLPSFPPVFHPQPLDGTSLELRIRAQDWQVSRKFNIGPPGGSEASEVFREIITKLVPDEDLPARDWRVRSGRD